MNNSQFEPAYEIYRHKESKGLYIILGDCLIEDGCILSVIYQSLENGQVWVRPTKEFFDGRFELVDLNKLKED